MSGKTKEDLIQDSAIYFVSHPDADIFYATKDGMFFSGEEKLEATYHACEISSELFEINRSDLPEEAEAMAPKFNDNKVNKSK